MVVVQSCRSTWFLILSFLPFVVRTPEFRDGVNRLMKYHWNKLFGIVDGTWEYNRAPLLCLYPESLRRCRRRRVDVIIERLGGMVQGNGILEVNGSLSRLRSPLRRGPRQAGLPFLSFLSRVSLSPDPSSQLGRPRISFSFVFTQSRQKNFHPLSLSHSQINTSLMPSSVHRE